MIRTGDEYRESISDGREVWIDGERVKDVADHPMFKPIVDVRARIYDLAHEEATQDAMTYVDDESGERNAIANKLPRTQQDWHDKRAAVDLVLRGQPAAWSPASATRPSARCGRCSTARTSSTRSTRASRRTSAATSTGRSRADPFHVSANTDPKGDRSKAPQDQDPDMLLHVVKETDNGIVVRGAKYETAAAYSNQAFTKPTIANWGNSELSDYAVGFVLRHGLRPG